MTSMIHILDENTANKIAAGEVVERPASVVKELIENSVDAASSKIEIEIADGGTAYIRITDDGIGMNSQDAQLAILRHATSKIQAVEDLYHIQTLGFRGEALPSIAAVSKFTMITRQHDAPLATHIEIAGGVIQQVREAGANVGTTITVSELFFNTPARQKFLKSANTESSNINIVIGKAALSHPAIAFKLLNNNKLVLSTPGNGNLLETAAGLYGPQAAAEMLSVSHEQDGIEVTGFVGKPTLLKSSRQWQTFVVNNRVVSSRMLSKALDNAYHSLLPKAGYPLAILHITVPTETIDVNVHPQKSEIKFSDEQSIFRAVYRAIVNALTSQHAPLAIATPIRAAHTPPVSAWKPSDTAPASVIPAYKPAPSLWKEDSLPIQAAQTARLQQSDLAGVDSAFQSNYESLPHQESPSEAQFNLRPLGQVSECYIIAQGEDGLFIVDQHAAHERILYDRFSQSVGRIPAQQLLVPLLITIDENDIHIIMENDSTLRELGFSLEQVGPSLLRVSELPADLPQSDIEATLREIIMAFRNNQQPTGQELRHAILQIAACRAAIKAGDTLNMRQIQALLGELCTTTLPFTCPHGRPAIIRFSTDELAKMFKRT